MISLRTSPAAAQPVFFRRAEAASGPASAGGRRADGSAPPARSGEAQPGDKQADGAQSAGAKSADKQGAKPAAGSDKSAEKSTSAPKGADGQPLTADQLQLIHDLQIRDVAVRAHEAAHQAVGGSLTGGASFSYETGPDGKRYAVGGEVSVDLSTSDDPNDTIARMARVRAAALAPADPSAQDRSVAASAAAIIARAQTELLRMHQAQQAEQQKGTKVDATA